MFWLHVMDAADICILAGQLAQPRASGDIIAGSGIDQTAALSLGLLKKSVDNDCRRHGRGAARILFQPMFFKAYWIVRLGKAVFFSSSAT